MKILILSVLCFLPSCASRNPASARNSVVWQALKASGMSATLSGETRAYTAENVNCLRDLSKDLWRCSFTSQGKTFVIPAAESATLSDILFALPVAKGDSGAATPFIGCRSHDGEAESAQCDIAVPLDPVI